jgi:hypothetical protein
MSIIEKAITNGMIEEKIKQLKPIHPEPAAVAKRIHEMTLKEAVNSIDVADNVMRGAREKALAVFTLLNGVKIL